MAIISLCCFLTVVSPTLMVSAAPAGPGVYKVTATDGLNVRSGPGTNYARVNGINYGATFTVIQVTGNWGYVPSYGGYACLDYAQLIQTASNSMTSANIQNGYYAISSKLNNSKVIDIYGGYRDNGTAAILYDWQGSDNQIFYFERLADGTYRIQAKHSGRHLEVRNSSHDNGTDVAQWDWHDDYACKRWYIIDFGNGYYKFINKESGKVLDVQGASTANCTRIQQYQDNGSDAQRFKLLYINPVSSNSTITSKLDALINGTAPLRYNGSIQYAKAGTTWTDWQSSEWGWQCKGFATAVFYELYGYNVAASYQSANRHVLNISTAKTTTIFSEYRSTKDRLITLLKSTCPGDYIQMAKSTSQHSIIVYSVESNGLWIYDANSDGYNTIKKQFRDWDYFYNYIGSSSYSISAYRAK